MNGTFIIKKSYVFDMQWWSFNLTKKNTFSQLEIFSKVNFLMLYLSSIIDRYLSAIGLKNPSNTIWKERVISTQKCISICGYFVSFAIIVFDWRQKEVGKIIRVRFPSCTIKPKAYFSYWAYCIWSKSLLSCRK